MGPRTGRHRRTPLDPAKWISLEGEPPEGNLSPGWKRDAAVAKWTRRAIYAWTLAGGPILDDEERALTIQLRYTEDAYNRIRQNEDLMKQQPLPPVAGIVYGLLGIAYKGDKRPVSLDLEVGSVPEGTTGVRFRFGITAEAKEAAEGLPQPALGSAEWGRVRTRLPGHGEA